jgi:uncharacterized protein (DUF2141 family)
MLATAALLASASAELYPKTGTIAVKVVGLETAKGTVRGHLFNSKDSWLKYDRAICAASAKAKQGETVLRFERVPLNDRYALSIYQDENENGKMDAGSFIPIPKEPVGASNHDGNSMPRYFECSFYFKTSPSDLTVKLRKL